MPSFHGKADLSSRGGRAYQGLRAGVSRRRVEPAEARRDAGRQRSRNQEWRIPVKPDASGGFYHKFDALTPATGDYAIKYEPAGMKPKAKEPAKDADAADETKDDQQVENGDEQAAPAAAPEDLSCGNFPFKKEAYRLPTFEVVLNAPQMVPLDGEFSVDLLARYFAGGLAADRPVKWRAAQFPYVFTPPGREVFCFRPTRAFPAAPSSNRPPFWSAISAPTPAAPRA